MKADAAHPPRLVWAAGVAVMVLAALAGLGIFDAKQPYGFDLWAYVLAAQHLLAGQPLYPPEPTVPAGPLGEFHYAPGDDRLVDGGVSVLAGRHSLIFAALAQR